MKAKGGRMQDQGGSGKDTLDRLRRSCFEERDLGKKDEAAAVRRLSQRFRRLEKSLRQPRKSLRQMEQSSCQSGKLLR